ncbi:MAG: Hpt domain-containing protein [Anaerosacchariphilus sp.]
MTLEQFYAAVGGDYEQTLSRLSSEALVKKFVLKYADDGTCIELADAIESRDWGTAFRAAHTLKGIALNLGFDSLYTVSSELTEVLRGGKPLTDMSLWAAVDEKHKQIVDAIAQIDV